VCAGVGDHCDGGVAYLEHETKLDLTPRWRFCDCYTKGTYTLIRKEVGLLDDV